MGQSTLEDSDPLDLFFKVGQRRADKNKITSPQRKCYFT